MNTRARRLSNRLSWRRKDSRDGRGSSTQFMLRELHGLLCRNSARRYRSAGGQQLARAAPGSGFPYRRSLARVCTELENVARLAQETAAAQSAGH